MPGSQGRHGSLRRSMTTPRILVVEDEFLLASALEEDLASLGLSVVGPYSDLNAAIAAARNETFDAAILDINLGGEMVYPLADELAARHCPILFVSGYTSAHLPDRYAAWPRLAKPYDSQSLSRALERILHR
jgi:DNA-binding response OmpR family regulator